jgi:hypothetical protein
VLVTVFGSTDTAMVVVASDTGGVSTGDAGGVVRSTVAMDHSGIDKVLPQDALQREFTKMNLEPRTGAMRSSNHDVEFATIATHYRFLQGHYPDLIIDVLPVQTKLGRRASFELANRGVQHVLLDSDARLQRAFISLPQDEEIDAKPLLRADVDALPELALR